MVAWCLTGCALLPRRISSFGIHDQFTLDLKFALVNVPEDHWTKKSKNNQSGLDILADGNKEIVALADLWVRSFESKTKESLADKPLKIVLKESQKYLSLGYDRA